MKNGFILLLLLSSVLVGCSKGKSAPQSPMSSQFTLEPFEDVNRESSFNEEELRDLPRSVDLSSGMTSVKTQDDRGTCSFFSATALAEAAIKKKTNKDVNLSEEYINYIVKSDGLHKYSEGSVALFNLRRMKKLNEGFAFESQWPYQPLWFGLKKECQDHSPDDKSAPAVCFSHKALTDKTKINKIPLDSFTILSGFDTTNEIIRFLAERKLPISVGVPVNHKGWPDSGVITYDQAMRQECIDLKVECGGHEVVLTGYDLDKKVFYFKNSWSTDWGNKGYGTFPIDMIDRHSDIEISGAIFLTKDIILPEKGLIVDATLPKFKFHNLSSKQNALDSSIDITSSTIIENVGLFPIRYGSMLVRKDGDLTKMANDENSKLVEVSQEDQKELDIASYIGEGVYVFPINDQASWNSIGEPLVFPSVQMKAPSIKKLLNSKDQELYIRSSVYLYTDEGVKILKRIYHPFNYSK